MASLVCDLCGGKLVMGAGGVATCDTCGMEYSADRMREKVAELKANGGVSAPVSAPAAAPAPVVDNTAMIENFLSMARNAKTNGNNTEAVDYCNKVIEMDITNWEAWFIKGKAVGWQSTLANNRVGEAISAFCTAIDHCPAEKMDELIDDCIEEINDLHYALLSLRVKNFKTHPNQNDMNGLRGDVQAIVVNVGNFLLKSKGRIPVNNIKFARCINNGICDAWKVVHDDFKGDGHPTDYDLTRFISEGDFLLEAMELAFIFCSDDEDDKDAAEYAKLKIQIYENLIHMQKTITNAQSYEVDFTGGYKHYNASKSLTDAAKRIRRSKVTEWEGKISDIKAIDERKKAAAAKKRFDEYWEAHADKKKELEDERAELLKQVSALLEEEKRIPGGEEKAKLQTRIAQLTAEKESLGLFKGKEKKALQEQIDAANAQMKVISDRMAAAKAELEKKLKPLNDRLSAIKTELTKPR